MAYIAAKIEYLLNEFKIPFLQDFISRDLKYIPINIYEHVYIVYDHKKIKYKENYICK